MMWRMELQGLELKKRTNAEVISYMKYLLKEDGNIFRIDHVRVYAWHYLRVSNIVMQDHDWHTLEQAFVIGNIYFQKRMEVC